MQQNLSVSSLQSLLYPISAGLFAFLATVLGSHFFNSSHSLVYIALGIFLFLISNHLLYKLKFNSDRINGSTVTTVLVFVSQTVAMAIYKWRQIGSMWVLGVGLVLIGTALIHSDGSTKGSTEQQIRKEKEESKMDKYSLQEDRQVKKNEYQNKSQ